MALAAKLRKHNLSACLMDPGIPLSVLKTLPYVLFVLAHQPSIAGSPGGAVPG